MFAVIGETGDAAGGGGDVDAGVEFVMGIKPVNGEDPEDIDIFGM